MAIVEYILFIQVRDKYIDLFICIFQWDLICDKSILGSVSSSVIFAGWLLGVVILGWVSDKFGRREVMYFSTALAAVFGFASGFSPLFWLFVAARFVVGFLLGKSKFLKFRLYFRDLSLVFFQYFARFVYQSGVIYHCITRTVAWPDGVYSFIDVTYQWCIQIKCSKGREEGGGRDDKKMSLSGLKKEREFVE